MLALAVSIDVEATDKPAIKAKEKAIKELSQLYFKHDKVAEMRRLIDDIRPFLEMVSKAKGGKVFKNLIDRFVELKSATAEEVRAREAFNSPVLLSSLVILITVGKPPLTPPPDSQKVSMCRDCITWAQEKKRTFLRQALEVRLIALHLDALEFQECLADVEPLIKELKRLDDRQLLVEVRHARWVERVICSLYC